MDDKIINIFFRIIQAGLFGKKSIDSGLDDASFYEVYRLSNEQSVVGLFAAGLDLIGENRIPQKEVLTVVGDALQLEHQNSAMNYFIGVLFDKLNAIGIKPVLVKGQGVAQCYDKPLWRACGDVDLYLDLDDFVKAKAFFRPLVTSFDPDNDYSRHINMHYDSWVVEIHADQHCGLSFKIDGVLDSIHEDLFHKRNVRLWKNGQTEIPLPSPDSDVLIIFTHFLKHFYGGGLGIRQICDWSRLLWKYSGEIDTVLLEKRLKKMRLMSEWKAFGAFSVEYLGMPREAMPFYTPDLKWKRKADKICSFIIEVGNFGHNRDTSYYIKYPYLIRKTISFGRRLNDLYKHARIFPLESIRFLPGIIINGLRAATNGV